MVEARQEERIMTHRIIVCGIYRSGTSLTTKLIREWGAYTGKESDIFQDEYGYLEHLALQKLNDELLGENSRVPTPVDQLIEKAQNPSLRERALEILTHMDQETEQNGNTAWVWKDPRLPLALPFWANIWGNVTYVIPVRHPVETIHSAATMEGLEPEQVPLSAGLAYWQFCMLNILQFTQNSERKIFIGYDQLIQHPQRESARLGQFLAAQHGNRKDNGLIENMASQVTSSERHFHHQQALAQINTATREQRALFNFLRVKTIYPDEPFNPDDFALYPGWLEYLYAMDMLLSSNQQGFDS
jgi:hypothetical protein